MLNIGVVGLGAISQKAYLPYMRQLSDITWHLSTRNAAVRQQVGQLFGHAILYSDVKELSKASLDGVFIHAATSAHAELASLFLNQGIPVFMDKPIADNYLMTKNLYDLAKENQTFLMAGFNRRFTPRVKKLSSLSTKRKVAVEKNDLNRPGDMTFKLFDFFIHPLDTALFLTEGTLLKGHFQYHLEAGLLSQVMVTLMTESMTTTASMNLQSGSRREVMEVQRAEETYHLENLDELSIYKGTEKRVLGFASWDTTLHKRGFETMIDAFLEAISTGVNPVSPESSLLSHWICQQIADSQLSYGELTVELPKD
ncbi:TPA: Gfo/Idh/MocA family oxidoreductase [Streptococcus pyogenes]|uniref:Gfo/Idh/MocA family protein n=1 Tax=Streptococcus pyogenes TaxID=1314 RepID=UPI00109BB0CF|nr:Gfo/Idh/MocA family oxidoreductase [Streptococcus pyogenes]VGS37366.1 oxidoreductase [Streptococcus pyogenes]HES0416203.1 Gfo/Idh/MocA family oxidoreductase [Streptococcus pyogenes]HES0433359.1 Gfo/Idh/MocA family oxidoreductase [Streptococcus pyogenes]HES0755357.1 Gfo/Idh/MocA family oxidoreductase [Streptococcus pyogenes]HES0758813.1 Gfo/Idh/MocA family oxidoreductase [Streptococcus pyogenes]